MMLTAAATLESWKSLLLPRKEETLEAKEKLFSNRQLRQMLVSLFIEQILVVGLAMCSDWLIRAVLMIGRWQSGAWKEKQLI